MRWFFAVAMGVLVGLPATGRSQDAQTSPAAPAKSSPAVSSARDSEVKAAPAATAVVKPTGNDGTGSSIAAHYIIGPEDTLQVTVWKEPTLSGSFPVRPDGMISLVLVGDLPAA